FSAFSALTGFALAGFALATALPTGFAALALTPFALAADFFAAVFTMSNRPAFSETRALAGARGSDGRLRDAGPVRSRPVTRRGDGRRVPGAGTRSRPRGCGRGR